MFDFDSLSKAIAARRCSASAISCIDEFVYGEVTRIRRKRRAGDRGSAAARPISAAPANVARNIAALGAAASRRIDRGGRRGAPD